MTTQNQKDPPILELNMPLQHLTDKQAASIMYKCDCLNEEGRAMNLLFAIGHLQMDYQNMELEVTGMNAEVKRKVLMAISDLLYLFEDYLPEI